MASQQDDRHRQAVAMRITIASLRLWIIVMAVLLVASLAGFFVYARYRARQFVADLPDKLGAKIARSSNGFTYSQSVKGRTAFTIHASNAVQYTGGASATLHDVVITLYGAQGDRSDRISGSEFDYDQKAGIVTAKGEVMIDLQGADLAGSPVPVLRKMRSPLSAAAGITANPAQQVIHVKTSGLVFDQNKQIATTSQHVEFSTPRGGGQSIGATYEVQKGLLVLQSAVELTSGPKRRTRRGPCLPRRVSALQHAGFPLESECPTTNPIRPPPTRRSSTFAKTGRPNTSTPRAIFDLKTDGGQELTCRLAKILLDLKSQPQRADVSGGVNFVSLGGQAGREETGGRKADGRQAGRRTADARQCRRRHRHLRGRRRTQPCPGAQCGQLRRSATGPGRRPGRLGDPRTSRLPGRRGLRPGRQRSCSVAEKVLAAGGATAVLHTIRTKAASQNTTIKGDQLLATLRDGHTIPASTAPGTPAFSTSPRPAPRTSAPATPCR